ncbi:hypothetical protein [Stenotrophomonas phage RAS14]
MATSILAPGLTEAVSDEFTIADGECVLLSVYNPDGLNMEVGPVLTVQRADINGNFITLATVQYSAIRFDANMQQVTLSMPGTYRVARPDISAWNFEIGISLGV